MHRKKPNITDGLVLSVLPIIPWRLWNMFPVDNWGEGTTIGAPGTSPPTPPGGIKVLFSVPGSVCNWSGRPFYLRVIILAA